MVEGSRTSTPQTLLPLNSSDLAYLLLCASYMRAGPAGTLLQVLALAKEMHGLLPHVVWHCRPFTQKVRGEFRKGLVTYIVQTRSCSLSPREIQRLYGIVNSH